MIDKVYFDQHTGQINFERKNDDDIEFTRRNTPTSEELRALKNAAYGKPINGDGPLLRELYWKFVTGGE